jgi:hypothetical protein
MEERVSVEIDIKAAATGMCSPVSMSAGPDRGAGARMGGPVSISAGPDRRGRLE